MKVTFIIKNLTESVHESLSVMNDRDRFEALSKFAYGDLKHCVSVKFGSSNRFADRVTVNSMMKAGKPFKSYDIAPRRGYRLATFEI